MRTFISLLALLNCLCSFSQENHENHDLVFDSLDLTIIERADAVLSDSLKWNKSDDRECADDIETGNYSLFCTLYKASIEIMGEYVHRRAAMQIVRFTLEKYENGRVKDHRLMDWNNHPDTTFNEVKQVLQESLDTIRKQIEEK
jgi:hypothetical protein